MIKRGVNLAFSFALFLPCLVMAKSKAVASPLMEHENECVSTLHSLSAADAISSLPQRPGFGEIVDETLFNELFARRKEPPAADANPDDLPIARLAKSFSLLILVKMNEKGINLNSPDFADLFQVLYFFVEKKIIGFELARVTQNNTSIKKALTAHLARNLGFQILHYWKPRPNEEYRVARDPITAIRRLSRLTLATDYAVQNESIDDPGAADEAFENLAVDETAPEDRTHIHDFGNFIAALKEKYPANSSAFQIRETVIALRWLGGNNELIKEVGLTFVAPEIEKTEKQWSKTEWTIREIADFAGFNRTWIPQVAASLTEDFTEFQKRGKLGPRSSQRAKKSSSAEAQNH